MATKYFRFQIDYINPMIVLDTLFILIKIYFHVQLINSLRD